jgi:hypothetical protein
VALEMGDDAVHWVPTEKPAWSSTTTSPAPASRKFRVPEGQATVGTLHG